MVDVVGVETGWNVDDHIVQMYSLGVLLVWHCNRPGRVGGVGGFADMPFVGAQAVVIFGVDNSELALGQWNASEPIAVTNPAVEKYDRQ